MRVTTPSWSTAVAVAACAALLAAWPLPGQAADQKFKQKGDRKSVV